MEEWNAVQQWLLDLRNASQLMMELSGKVYGKMAVGIIPSITDSVLADVLSRAAALNASCNALVKVSGEGVAVM